MTSRPRRHRRASLRRSSPIGSPTHCVQLPATVADQPQQPVIALTPLLKVDARGFTEAIALPSKESA